MKKYQIEAAEAYHYGERVKVIAERLGVTPRTVRSWLREYKIIMQQNKVVEPPTTPTRTPTATPQPIPNTATDVEPQEHRDYAPLSTTQFFWYNVEKSDVEPDDDSDIIGPCWDWIGATDMYGYAWFKNGDVDLSARLVSYAIHHPEETVMQRSEFSIRCGNKLCVNPDHLERIS